MNKEKIMKDGKVTSEELTQRQAWSWKKKVDHSLGVIDQFISRMDGKAFVSFSGGKDSSVLLDLCQIIKPDIKAVFFNTGMELWVVEPQLDDNLNCKLYDRQRKKSVCRSALLGVH